MIVYTYRSPTVVEVRAYLATGMTLMHKCPDWDDIWVGEGDDEMEGCTCSDPFLNRLEKEESK